MNCDGDAVVVVKYTAGRVPAAAPLFSVKMLDGLLGRALLLGYGTSVAVDATTLIVTYRVVVLLVVVVEYVSVLATEGVVAAAAVTGHTVV